MNKKIWLIYFFSELITVMIQIRSEKNSPKITLKGFKYYFILNHCGINFKISKVLHKSNG